MQAGNSLHEAPHLVSLTQCSPGSHDILALKLDTLLCLQAGDKLYTASMKPIMTFLEQTGPGCHDTTAAACSYGLYVLQIGEVSRCLLILLAHSSLF